jgi:hypothetical protein
MAPHIKTDVERRTDRAKLKQVALLWWAQRLYQFADQTCQDTNAYDDTTRKLYSQVLNEFKKAFEGLNKVRTDLGAQPKALTLVRRLENDEKERQASPNGPSPSRNCTSDDDCPDDYICVEKFCEYLFPEA